MCKPRDLYSTQIFQQPVHWEDIGGLDEAKVKKNNPIPWLYLLSKTFPIITLMIISDSYI